MADRVTVEISVSRLLRFGRGMNGITSALTKIPPTARSRPGRPAQAISDTRSWRPASLGLSLPPAGSRAGNTQMVRTAARFEAPCGQRFVEIGAPRGRRPISEGTNDKARDRSPGAGSTFNACDDATMPVICPTCQIFEDVGLFALLDLFKTLNRRRLGGRWRLGRSGGRRRTCLARGLRIRHRIRLRGSLHPRTRRGPSHAP